MRNGKPVFHFDYETRSEVDLLVAGIALYAPAAEVIIAAGAINDEKVRVWDRLGGQEMPAWFEDAMSDNRVEKMAWNARFEQELTATNFPKFKIPPELWVDPMIIVQSMALPGHLGGAGPALGMKGDDVKDSGGKRLINKFSSPRAPTKTKPWRWCTPETDPEDWALFCNYCGQDVVAERNIWNFVEPFDLQDWEWELWRLDGKINRRGMPVDEELVQAAIDMDADEKARLIRKAQEITGLENPNSLTQLVPWLKDRGYPHSSISKTILPVVIAHHQLRPEVAEVLKLRAAISSTSVSKYKAILEVLHEGRLKNTYQFRGAGRTGRWAGRKPQFQNVIRPKFSCVETMIPLIKEGDSESLEALVGPVTDCLSSCVRASITAPPNKVLRVADLSAIEVRVIGWLADCKPLLDVFHHNLDPYKVFAVPFLNVPYEQVTKVQRNMCKPPVLGCGFGLSGGDIIEEEDTDTGAIIPIKTGLLGYAESMGVDLTPEESHAAVQIYRDSYPEVVQWWYALERAFFDVLLDRKAVAHVGHIGFRKTTSNAVQMRLPSGRRLTYFKPAVESMKMPWKDKDGKPVFKDVITYFGVNQRTKRLGRIPTRGAKLAENAVQAVAADILSWGMTLADQEGFKIVGHVHDEIIAECFADDNKHTVKRLESLMCRKISWAPGLPLGAEGYESKHWKKN